MSARELLGLMLAAAVAFAIFNLTLQVAANVILPAIDQVLGTGLRSGIIRLGNKPERMIFLGPLLASFIAGLTTVALFGSLYRNAWQKEMESSVDCPHCLSLVPAEATKCAFCGSDLSERDV